VEQLRKEYSWEDKELIDKFLEAKRIFNLKSESLAQELEEKGQLPGKIGTINSQLFLFCC
jgi:ribosomal 50S subunit-recycling heat shock protein